MQADSLPSLPPEFFLNALLAIFFCFLLDFHGSSDGKGSAYNAGHPRSIPGSGRSPGEGNGNPLQYSCLENPMDGGAWEATVQGVTQSRTRLSDFTFTFSFLPEFHFKIETHILCVLSSLKSSKDPFYPQLDSLSFISLYFKPPRIGLRWQRKKSKKSPFPFFLGQETSSTIV